MSEFGVVQPRCSEDLGRPQLVPMHVRCALSEPLVLHVHVEENRVMVGGRIGAAGAEDTGEGKYFVRVGGRGRVPSVSFGERKARAGASHDPERGQGGADWEKGLDVRRVLEGLLDDPVTPRRRALVEVDAKTTLLVLVFDANASYVHDRGAWDAELHTLLKEEPLVLQSIAWRSGCQLIPGRQHAVQAPVREPIVGEEQVLPKRVGEDAPAPWCLAVLTGHVHSAEKAHQWIQQEHQQVASDLVVAED
mmetsp:Transcript_17893/g.52265  ORF Transcript_17893/g.52265 Transcript_17893/m.52265 type:complete len:249 (-) Transcript_17893:409-1155(-)